MKAFDLEKAREGAKVCTRDGDSVRIICFDRKNEDFPIVALLTCVDGEEIVETYTEDGYFDKRKTWDELDLMLAD